MDLNFSQITTIIGLISGIITIVAFAKPLRTLFDNKINKIDKGCIENIFYLSYLLLRTDQIKETGLWGRTITKYINLNFPDNKDIKKKYNHYKVNGSITHTAHALKAFYKLWKYVGHYPDLKFEQIEEYLRRIRRKSGMFHPDHEAITNIEEVNNLANELRHNSTSLSTIYYLKHFTRDKDKIVLYNSWIVESLTFVLKLPHDNLWKCDPEYGHSLAYMLESFILIKADPDLPPKLKIKLQRYIFEGIDTLIARLEGNFWLLTKHNATKCFYTLLILDILLQADEFKGNEANIDIAYRIVMNLASLRNQDNGLSLGALNDNTKYSISDIGVTARYALVLQRLIEITANYNLDSWSMKIDEIHRLGKKSQLFIAESYTNYITANYNSFTHSFESVLLLIDAYKPLDKAKLRNDLIRADQIVNRLFSRPKLSFRDIDLHSTPHGDFINNIVVRDMIHNPSRTANMLGFKTYWS